MCVIIMRQPGVDIPLDKLELACDINKHGFGLAFTRKQEICIERDIGKNDAKEIHKLLEKHKNRTVYLHLRHATVGPVTLENNHPLMVLERKRDGIDLALMHNGTLPMYGKPDDVKQSDTVFFTETFLRPLAQRCLAFAGGKKLLHDEFFINLVQNEIGTSVILLIDGSKGETLLFNKAKGAQYDGWWASNSYSFDPKHYRSSFKPPIASIPYRYPSATAGQVTPPWADYAFDYNPELSEVPLSLWEQELREHDQRDSGLEVENTEFAEILAVEKRIKGTVYVYGESIMQDGVVLKDLKIAKVPFTRQANLKSLNDVGVLSEKDLREMCSTYPFAMTALIIELLGARQELLAKNATQAQTIKSLTDKK